MPRAKGAACAELTTCRSGCRNRLLTRSPYGCAPLGPVRVWKEKDGASPGGNEAPSLQEQAKDSSPLPLFSPIIDPFLGGLLVHLPPSSSGTE